MVIVKQFKGNQGSHTFCFNTSYFEDEPSLGGPMYPMQSTIRVHPSHGPGWYWLLPLQWRQSRLTHNETKWGGKKSRREVCMLSVALQTWDFFTSNWSLKNVQHYCNYIGLDCNFRSTWAQIEPSGRIYGASLLSTPDQFSSFRIRTLFFGISITKSCGWSQ